MTPNLPNDQRTRLAVLIGFLRPDWDHAGIMKTLGDLDQQATSPQHVVKIAIGWATRTDSRVPAGMLDPKLRDYPEPGKTGIASTPRPNPEPCETHAASHRRADGELSCCWSERITAKTQPAPEPFPHRRPVPDTARQLVTAALGTNHDAGGPGTRCGNTNDDVRRADARREVDQLGTAVTVDVPESNNDPEVQS